MATTVWKGHLTFGLVSIPVRLFRAARAEKIPLRQLHQRPATPRPAAIPFLTPSAAGRAHVVETPDIQPNNAARETKQVFEPPAMEPRTAEPTPVTRIHQTAYDPVEHTPIPRSELVRGFEVAKGQYSTVDEEDLRQITPKTASEMQIVEFVRFADIDPVYLETSYYMSPDEAGEKAYALLFEGMRESGYVALAQTAMHRREHVMILRPGKKGIITHTMYYPDEVRSIEEFRTDVSMVTPKELGLAKMLIDALAANFEPTKFKDTYRERLRALIESKVPTAQAAQEAPLAHSKIIDITEALRKSLEAASALRAASTGSEPETPRKAVKSERTTTKKGQRTK